MAVRDSLRRMDDRVLRRRTTERAGPSGVSVFLGVFGQVCRVVFGILALILALAVVLVAVPGVNEANVIVHNILAAADQVAGPFGSLFDLSNRSLRAAANYGVGALVYFVAGMLLGRLGSVATRRSTVVLTEQYPTQQRATEQRTVESTRTTTER